MQNSNTILCIKHPVPCISQRLKGSCTVPGSAEMNCVRWKKTTAVKIKPCLWCPENNYTLNIDRPLILGENQCLWLGRNQSLVLRSPKFIMYLIEAHQLAHLVKLATCCGRLEFQRSFLKSLFQWSRVWLVWVVATGHFRERQSVTWLTRNDEE